MTSSGTTIDKPPAKSNPNMEIFTLPEHQSSSQNPVQPMDIIVEDDGFTKVESKTAKKKRKREL